MNVTRDTLFILVPEFTDPALPGRRFYCEHCALMEGLLALHPELASRLEVRRVAFPRPRKEVVASVGEANQDLPLLLLADDAPPELATGEHQGRRFVSGKQAILRVLARRHGLPEAHP